MRTYVYYGYLSQEAYQKLASTGSKVIVAPLNLDLDMTKSERKSRKKEQAFEMAANIFVVSSSILASAIPHGPSLPKNFNAVLSGVSGARTSAQSNPLNTFYTNDNNFEINISEDQLDLRHVEVYEQGKKIAARTWTDRLPDSGAVAKAERAGANANNPNVPVMCFFVSPIPPEVVHQQHKLQFGLVTRYKKDLKTFMQASHQSSASFKWSDRAQAIIEPKNMDDLIDRIPYELLHTVDPKKLGIKNFDLIQKYERITKIYDDLANRLKKLENESIFTKFARNFSSMIPFLRTEPFSDNDAKAFNHYQVELNEYRTALKNYFAHVSKIEPKQFQPIIEKMIQGKTFHDIINRFDSFMLRKIDPIKLLSKFKNHETYAVYLAELNEGLRNFSEHTPGSEENYRKIILDTFVSLQRTYPLDQQPIFNDLMDETLQPLITKADLPNITKFGAFSKFTVNDEYIKIPPAKAENFTDQKEKEEEKKDNRTSQSSKPLQNKK